MEVAPSEAAQLALPEAPLPAQPPSRPGSAAYAEKLASNLHRHVKRVQQLQAAAAARAAKQRELEQRQAAAAARAAKQRALEEQQAAANNKKKYRTEMRRQEKLAAAQARDEQARRQAAARLEQGAARGAAVAAERQEVAVLARVKHERREAARRLAQSRAEQEAAERAAFYLQRQQQKEAELRQRNEELAELRALKQRERRLAALHAKHRMELAAQRQEAARDELSRRLDAKQRRVSAMEGERAAMMRALEDMRRDIRQQEDALKEALRHMERGGCAPVQELDGLQRQLGELLQSPATRPPSSRGSTRQGARPSSRGRTAGVGTGGAAPQRGSRDAVAEQVAEASARGCSTLSSSAAVDSIGSPRIPAVHAVQPPAEAGGDRHDEAGSGSDSQQLSSRASVAHPADAQARCTVDGVEEQGRPAQQAPPLAPPVAREKLQQILQAELAREAERAVVLRGVADEADRRRLVHFFEMERANAMSLMQRLQQQMQ